MKKLSLLLCFLIMIPATIFGNEWLVDTKLINLGCKCELASSSILSNLDGSCSGDDFKLTDQGLKELFKDHTLYVVSSWKDFLYFKDRFFISPFFETISKDFFDKNRLVALHVSYTGSKFIKNEQIQSINQDCSFSYEIWDKTMEAIPACVWTSLYVFKIGKQ